MTRIELAPDVLDDFERIIDHLRQFAVENPHERIEEIVRAVEILTQSPLIGRPVRGGKRELIIGKESRGYIALYRYSEHMDTVFVLAVRSQRESGYKEPKTGQNRWPI